MLPVKEAIDVFRATSSVVGSIIGYFRPKVKVAIYLGPGEILHDGNYYQYPALTLEFANTGKELVNIEQIALVWRDRRVYLRQHVDESVCTITLPAEIPPGRNIRCFCDVRYHWLERNFSRDTKLKAWFRDQGMNEYLSKECQFTIAELYERGIADQY